MIVLDTSALLFHLFSPEKLSPPAVIAISQSDQLVISTISIWEIALKVKQGKLDLPITVSEMVRLLHQTERVHLHAVDVETWLDNVALDWSHRDPADRTVVATAKLLNCALITSDRQIRGFYEQTVW